MIKYNTYPITDEMQNKWNEFNELVSRLNSLGFVPFIWHIDDVKNNYNVTDEEALELLKEIQDHEWITEEVYKVIDNYCEQYEYERIDE